MDHVTEVKSNIYGKTISFRMMQDGNPVNTGKFRIKDLYGPGLLSVNVHDAINCLGRRPGLEISVLVNGKPTMILEPICLIMYVRITFNSSCSAAGRPTLYVTGLDSLKKDCFLRIRFLTEMRAKEYGIRENNPELATIIWEGPLEEEEKYVKRDNETYEAIAASVDVGFMQPNELIPEQSDNLGNNEAQISSTISPSSLSGSSYVLRENIDVRQPSPGRANDNNTTLMSLTYKKPSVVEGLGDVAVIPPSGINDNMVHQMSSVSLIGLLCDDETPRRESLIERLKEFGECQVGLLSGGFFAIFFSSDECKTEVLEHGQLFINNRPLILRRWTQHLTLKPSEFLKSVPVWIKFYLNWAYWSTDSLSRISSIIGTPISMDNFTATIVSDPRSIRTKCASTERHLDFARVCVEVDPYRALPENVNVSQNGKLVSISVEYEWTLQPCTHCHSLNHDSTSCNKDSEDVYSHPQDLRSQVKPAAQDHEILLESVVVEELEPFERILGRTLPSPHSSDNEIPGLIIDDDDDADGIIVPGENGPQSTELSIPESLNEALQGYVERNAGTPEVEATGLIKFFRFISRRVFRSRSQHLRRSITL